MRHVAGPIYLVLQGQSSHNRHERGEKREHSRTNTDHSKSQGERRRSSAGDEPRVAMESGAPDYGVEANGEDRASRAK